MKLILLTFLYHSGHSFFYHSGRQDPSYDYNYDVVSPDSDEVDSTQLKAGLTVKDEQKSIGSVNLSKSNPADGKERSLFERISSLERRVNRLESKKSRGFAQTHSRRSQKRKISPESDKWSFI